MKTNFENLLIYQLAEKLGHEIWCAVEIWKPFAKETIGKQLVRSADSVGANIAEGSGKGTDQDYRRYLRNARGSLYETKHWLRCAENRSLMRPEQVQLLTELVEELLPKLNAYMRAVTNRIESQPLQDPKPKA